MRIEIIEAIKTGVIGGDSVTCTAARFSFEKLNNLIIPE